MRRRYMDELLLYLGCGQREILLSNLWSNVSTNCLHVGLRCSFVVNVISCRDGEVRSPDLRSSRTLIFSDTSAGTDSVLSQCLPEGIGSDSAFSIMVCKIFSPFWQLVGRRFCSACPLFPYYIGPS